MTNERSEPWKHEGIDVSMERVRRALAAHLPEDHVAHSDWHRVRNAMLGAHPPREEWRLASEPPEDGRGRVIAWRHPPQRQGGAWIEALYDDGAWVTRDGIAHDITHWRDVQPPTEGQT